MKRFFTLFCAALMTLGTINAKLVLHEDFNREVGDLNSGLNTQMGSNTTDWWSYSGSNNYIKVAEGSLSYPGYVTTGTGNKAYIWSAGADDFRKFAQTYTSGKVYFAAIINVEELRQGTTSDYFLCLGDATASNMYARLYTKSVKEGDNFVGFQLGVAKYSETNTWVRFGKTVYSPKTTYLVVVEYEFVDGDKNDKVSLYVNPTKSTTKPTLECVQDTTNTAGTSQTGANSKNDASKISSVNLRQGTNTPRQVYVDEIKVATAWDDLFEDDVVPVNTPAISAASSVEFGNVNVNEAAEKKVTISGSDLKGAISVASNNTALVPSVESITKAQAEAEGGYELTLTLTAAEAGEGSATVTLSSEDATSKTISISWNAVAPVSGALTIAEAKLLAEETELALNDVVVTRIFQDGLAFSVQDATGALNIADYYGVCTSWKVGDKISGLSGMVMPSEDAMDGFCTVVPYSASVAESGVSIEPFEVSLSNFAQYGPALIKVQGVAFPNDVEKFTAGGITISQGAASANLQIPAGCDIIGEDVPASADVLGIVCHPYFTDNILLEKSADLTNRVAKTPTGIGEVTGNGLQVTGQKILRNGQLIIVKDGKMFNVLGTAL